MSTTAEPIVRPEPATCGHTTTGATGIEWICIAQRKPKGKHSHYYVRRYPNQETTP